jgi:hypothetical protein
MRLGQTAKEAFSFVITERFPAAQMRAGPARTGCGLPEGLAQPGGDQLPDERLWQWRINGKLKCSGRSLVLGEFLS